MEGFNHSNGPLNDPASSPSLCCNTTIIHRLHRQSAGAAEAELAARIGFAGAAGAGSLPETDAADAHSGNAVSRIDPSRSHMSAGQLCAAADRVKQGFGSGPSVTS